MAHVSPAVYLVWALLSTMLGSFLLFHLWSFDQFRCIKWNHDPRSGAFKRVMTYSYLLSVPLLIIYAVGFAIIKYNYGFTIIPEIGIIPTPYPLWSRAAQNAILPLYLSYSFAWGLEMVTHLEELCFWLFLINSGSVHRDWFESPYFKTWVFGSCIAVFTIPLITITTHKDVYKCEAYTFLAGALGSLSLTIWFLPVLWTFPSFLRNIKQYDVEMNTLVRLQKFHELNCIRVMFRFLFTIPLVILGVDGVRPHQHINDKMFATDFLGILAGIGCVVSSGITLVIFFPRSVEGEMARKEEQQSVRSRRTQQSWWGQSKLTMTETDESLSYISVSRSKSGLASSESTLPVGFGSGGLPNYEAAVAPSQPRLSTKRTTLGEMYHVEGSISLQPNRRTKAGDVEFGSVLTAGQVQLMRARSTREKSVSSLVQHWRSPIEIERPTESRWQLQP